MKPLIRLCLALAALAAPAPAETLTDPQFQEIAGAIFQPIIEEFDIPGMAIGLTFEGRHYVFVQGLANREDGLPVSADTIFELGSNSKLFTVTLAALADQQGHLSLQDPVARSLPQLAGSAFDRITLSDLAAHATASLPLQVPGAVTDIPALLAYLASWTPEADPGTVRSYSNISIGLLGLIAGESFGSSYETALTHEVLPRLGLQSTFVTVPPDALARYAFGYSRTNDRPVRVTPGLLDDEAYGIKSTVTDMIRLLDAHLGNIPLDDDMANALARTRLSEFDTAHYAQAMIWEGYGWPVKAATLAAGNAPEMAFEPQPMTRHPALALQGAVYLNKTGSTNGFGSYLALVPSKRIGVVVLANRNYPNPVRATATLDLVEMILAAAKDD